MNEFKVVQDKRLKFLESYHEYWTEHAFLTWQWWILVLATIFIWILWWKKVNKNQIQLILNYGLILAFISLLLDMVGQNYGLWAYPIRLYWAFIPPLVPFDMSFIPVIFMLIYQKYGQKWTYFLIAVSITSACISFLIEPLFKWMGIYVIYNWRSIYSFVIYIMLAFFVKTLVDFFNRKK
ncbi:hypothetical protein IEC97_22495 [Neobacillus cucumis]|uniref:CBO0543 family protein n=1 Tax=Neobacillus cucumis TaxID=1740721 RepID=UPI0018DEFCF8|nr:CBO0543 family protein [Neobacillus cucumis]MBI0580128.1 hypothetical protein [Neobacillus cucumis]